MFTVTSRHSLTRKFALCLLATLGIASSGCIGRGYDPQLGRITIPDREDDRDAGPRVLLTQNRSPNSDGRFQLNWDGGARATQSRLTGFAGHSMGTGNRLTGSHRTLGPYMTGSPYRTGGFRTGMPGVTASGRMPAGAYNSHSGRITGSSRATGSNRTTVGGRTTGLPGRRVEIRQGNGSAPDSRLRPRR